MCPRYENTGCVCVFVCELSQSILSSGITSIQCKVYMHQQTHIDTDADTGGDPTQ